LDVKDACTFDVKETCTSGDNGSRDVQETSTFGSNGTGDVQDAFTSRSVLTPARVICSPSGSHVSEEGKNHQSSLDDDDDDDLPPLLGLYRELTGNVVSEQDRETAERLEGIPLDVARRCRREGAYDQYSIPREAGDVGVAAVRTLLLPSCWHGVAPPILTSASPSAGSRTSTSTNRSCHCYSSSRNALIGVLLNMKEIRRTDHI
jgi:hypothetical protein